METSISGDPATHGALDHGRRRRRALIVGGVFLVVALALAAFFMRGGDKLAAPVDTSPRVTVIVPGRQAVTARISAVGNIAARRDMPVGIPGEGGIVRQVLVDAGTWVKAGQTLAVVDRSVQTQQAAAISAQIDQARADAQLARQNLNRAKQLVANGFVSRADIDTRQAALDGANARVALAQAQLAQQRALIGRLDVRAPTSGLVLTRAVEAGQVVGPGSTSLFRVAQDGKMELQARLADSELARLHVGSPATVTPVGSALRIPGQIWQISPVIDPNTRQGTVRIALPYNAALRPGGFGSAEIGGAAGNLPLLPESAVLSDAQGNFVYIVGPGNVIARRDVKTGEVGERGVTIASGLSGTERVVASAGAFLNAGDKVHPELQAASR
ncbi:efflux RND transporter periplasmic adaptor subunit [uncultured Sphingomonas sp.]|uniref:efflux RND transporter periplasmic adaptor subunit n=1 Tax=uncultured Sphingomonas sp. TaxID=158754 RepID=UPI0025F8EB15|nr:efflux RND transporter periplasmic adaptor subunit [uncultured Sphingomonas sp.]